MSLFKTRGLLLSNKLADVSNKSAAVTNLLSQYGGEGIKFTIDDIAPLIGISDTTFDPAQAFDTRLASLPYDGEYQTFKNIYDDYKLVFNDTSYVGGTGLAAKYYALDNDTLPAGFKDELDVNATPFDISAIFSEASPTITFDEIFDDPAVFPDMSDNYWSNGSFNYGSQSIDPKIKNINESNHSSFILYKGYYAHGSKTTYVRGPRVSTNLYVRLILIDPETDIRIIDASFEPGAVAEYAYPIDGHILEPFKHYEIQIGVFIIGDIQGDKKFSILREWNQYLAKNYLYPPEKDFSENPSIYKTKYAQTLKAQGSYLEVNAVDSPYENIEDRVGGILEADYKDLIIDGPIQINYQPPKNFKDIKKYTEVISNTYISENSNVLILEDDTNIEVGNYIDGIKSINGNAIYVKEIPERLHVHHRGTSPAIVVLTEKIDITSLDTYGSTTITFIEHRGLRSIGKLTHINQGANPPDFTIENVFENGTKFRGGDAVVFNTNAGDFFDNDVNWVQIRDVDPISFKTAGLEVAGKTVDGITENGGLIHNDGDSIRIFLYNQSGVDNLAMDNFCLFKDADESPAVSLIQAKIAGQREYAAPDGSNNDPALEVNVSTSSILEYGGNILDSGDLVDLNITYDAAQGLIEPDTTITAASDNGDGTTTLTLNNAPTATLGASTVFTIANYQDVALSKYECFRPSDTNPPFAGTGNGQRTRPETDLSVLSFQNTEDSPDSQVPCELQFNALNIHGDGITVTRPKTYAESTTLSYDTIVKFKGFTSIKSDNNVVSETTEGNFFIPLEAIV